MTAAEGQDHPNPSKENAVIENETTALTHNRSTTGNYTTWAVVGESRATTLTVVDATPQDAATLREIAPRAAADMTAADKVLASVTSHVHAPGAGFEQACQYLNRCESDTYVSSVAHPLFRAAAAAAFDDAAVFALLAELHAKAGAR